MAYGEEESPLLAVNSAGSKRSRRKCCFYYGIVATIFIIGLLALAAVFIAFYLMERKVSTPVAGGNGTVCLTPVCLELSAEILKSMDETKSPCNDFFNFACGQWVKKHALDPEEGVAQVLTEIAAENTLAIKDLLSGVNSSFIPALQKAKTLYDSCNNLTAIDNMGAAPLTNLLRMHLGGWQLANITPATPWNFKLLGRDQLFGSRAFFGFGVAADTYNSTLQSIYVYQSGLTIPIPRVYNITKFRELLLDFMTEIIYLLSDQVANKTQISVAMKPVVDLEVQLAQIFYDEAMLSNISLSYNRMSIQNLSDSYPISDQFDWLTYFQTQFNSTGSPQASVIKNTTEVVVQTPGYLANLSAILASTENETLNNYAKWMTVNRYLPLLSSSFRNVLNKFYEEVEGSPHVPTCVSVVTSGMQFAVSRLYTDSQVINGTIQRLNGTVNNILLAFKERLNAKKWLDAKTKAACIQKVNAITRQLAYPTFIHNDSYLNALYKELNFTEAEYFNNILAVGKLQLNNSLVHFFAPTDKSQWDLPPTVVNAYYDPSFNQFVFLEGILHPPVFHPQWPDYFLLGSFGVVAGHELTHGFDNTGQKYDLHGNYRKWWTNASQEAFDNRTKCYVQQYSKYSLMGVQINGQLTLGENIADNGGIHTSYQAYLDSKSKGNNYDLPYFADKYTHDQMFFIAFGQLWCSKFTKSYLKTSTRTDPHSPGPIRILGSLSNSVEFSEAFKCKAGDTYDPTQKCELW